MEDFSYLDPQSIYLDSACQSLRPKPVIDTVNDYYMKFNACADRSRYQWGITTSQKISDARQKTLKFLKLKPKNHFLCFTLNTSYAINMIMLSLDFSKFKKIITSDIEHNSVYLSSINFANKQNLPREVLPRQVDGSINLDADFSRAIVILNLVSNFDYRILTNLKSLTRKIHAAGGILILDAAQAVAHSAHLLQHSESDFICFSAHKTYGPSLGVLIAKKTTLDYIHPAMIAGGMVDDVSGDNYQLSFTNPEHLSTIFEPGLQPYAEIIGFSAAIDWLSHLPKSYSQNLNQNSQKLFDFLSNSPRIHLLNQQPAPVQSFFVEGLDSHLLASALSDQGIMVRSGYFCAHHYLGSVQKYPPLLRFSLGYHNTTKDIDQVIAKLTPVIQ